MSRAVLMSIKPNYAATIWSGAKKYELRRVCPAISNGDLVVVYESSPEMAITGCFTVKGVIHTSTEKLWNKVKSKAGIQEYAFNSYFEGKDMGYAIEVDQLMVFPRKYPLSELRQLIPEFHPPQSYMYLEEAFELSPLGSLGKIKNGITSGVFQSAC